MASALLVSGPGNPVTKRKFIDGSSLAPLCRVITPVGMLGYGFDENLTRDALTDMQSDGIPTALILDAGSTDSGPTKLATGSMTAPRENYERDLRKLLSLSYDFKLPILVSSAGGDGTDAHVEVYLDIIREICDEQAQSLYQFKAIALYSNIPKSKVFDALPSGKIQGCGTAVPSLTEANVEAAVQIVAQMGPEPFVQAMEAQPDFDIVIGGRAYDPSPYVAWCIFQARKNAPGVGLSDEQIGGFTHMGKIMECGALCATPKSHTSMATIYQDGTFDIKALSPSSRCTPFSVAAHTLYEKSRPDLLPGPGGILDLTRSTYIQLPDRESVRVQGANFLFSRSTGLPYTVKLEAAKIVGYRTIFMGGVRDPIFISQIPEIEKTIRNHVGSQIKTSEGEFWKLAHHVYGANGVMQLLEPGSKDYQPREIFVVGEVLASSQRLANAVGQTAKVGFIHGSYPGQRGTAGNFAFGVGGSPDIPMGVCAEFCVYHLLPLEIGEEGTRSVDEQASKSHATTALFPYKLVVIEGKGEPTVRSQTSSSLTKKMFPTPTKSQPKTIFASTLNYTTPQTLTDIAPVIRSKNAGPYEITLDVVFSCPQIYAIIKSSSLLSRSVIATMYHLAEDEIIWCGFYDQALGWKCTIPRIGVDIGYGVMGNETGQKRRVPSGGFMESDVHASQQYAGLLGLELSLEVREEIAKLGLSVD